MKFMLKVILFFSKHWTFGLLDIHAYFSFFFKLNLFYFNYCYLLLANQVIRKTNPFYILSYHLQLFLLYIGNFLQYNSNIWLWNSKIFLSILIWYLAKCKYYNVGIIFHVTVPNAGQNIVNISNITLILFCFQNLVFNFYLENLIIHVHSHL